jgi:hypothetical protein
MIMKWVNVVEEFKDEKWYISEESSEYSEWKWRKKKQPKRGQYLITEDKEKYDIVDVVVYTNEFTMIDDYGKDYGKKRSIDETNYDMCFWNRLSDDKDCHIIFLVCCNKS